MELLTYSGFMFQLFFVIDLKVLLELLQVGGVVQFNEERLLMLAEKAKL